MADVNSQQYSSSDSREDSNSQDDAKQQTPNVFRNDGSFMEMFKKMQEEQRRGQEEPRGTGSAVRTDPADKDHPKKSSLSFVGKRRGGRILATGMVKKQRREAVPEKKPVEGGKTDAWSQYMSEVRKYKEQSCEEEGKRRPLVK